MQTYDLDLNDPYSRNPKTLSLADNEWVNSIAVYSAVMTFSTTPEKPDLIFTTNLGNSIVCGQPVSTMKRAELLDSSNEILVHMETTTFNPSLYPSSVGLVSFKPIIYNFMASPLAGLQTESALYSAYTTTYPDNTRTTIDNRNAIYSAYKYDLPLISTITIYTYNLFCAGWKFTYQNGDEYKHYVIDDAEIAAPEAMTPYTMAQYEYITAVNGYEDKKTGEGGDEASAYEFITKDRSIMCGEKADGATATAILDAATNHILVTTVDSIQSTDAAKPYVVTTMAISIAATNYPVDPSASPDAGAGAGAGAGDGAGGDQSITLTPGTTSSSSVAYTAYYDTLVLPDATDIDDSAAVMEEFAYDDVPKIMEITAGTVTANG